MFRDNAQRHIRRRAEDGGFCSETMPFLRIFITVILFPKVSRVTRDSTGNRSYRINFDLDTPLFCTAVREKFFGIFHRTVSNPLLWVYFVRLANIRFRFVMIFLVAPAIISIESTRFRATAIWPFRRLSIRPLIVRILAKTTRNVLQSKWYFQELRVSDTRNSNSNKHAFRYETFDYLFKTRLPFFFLFFVINRINC